MNSLAGLAQKNTDESYSFWRIRHPTMPVLYSTIEGVDWTDRTNIAKPLAGQFCSFISRISIPTFFKLFDKIRTMCKTANFFYFFIGGGGLTHRAIKLTMVDLSLNRMVRLYVFLNKLSAQPVKVCLMAIYFGCKRKGRSFLRGYS